MHGTLLDQRVFEALVQRCLPIIYDHFRTVDVQLSVASLPWFLSLFAFRTACQRDLTSSQVHQQHADDLRIPDSRLLLLYGAQGPLPSRVSEVAVRQCSCHAHPRCLVLVSFRLSMQCAPF